MNDSLNFKAFVFISKKKFSICVIQSDNLTKIYENELFIQNNIDEIDFQKFQEFLDENVFKIEKNLKSFIKNIYVILRTDDFFYLQLSVKNDNNGNVLNPKNLSYSLNEARDQCKKTIQNQKIIHMLIDRYRIDDTDYTFLPENLKCNNYSLEINFICLSHNLIRKLENCLERYQISIDKILSAQYVESFLNNKESIFIKAKKITEGCNLNEVEFYDKTVKNVGFFEKFFNFFR